MEVFGVLIGLAIVGVLLLSPLLALVAFFRVNRLDREVEALRSRLAQVERRPGVAAPAAVGAPVKPDSPPVVATATTAPAPPPPPAEPVEAPVAAPPPTVPAAERAAPAVPRPTPRPPVPASPRAPLPDFATNLGPRLLVAAGAFAVIVFLGLFVKYAWENNWVGPAGRVLTGAVAGLALVVGGLRLLDREYRPLGQGLAGAGFAGLYVSAFAAHGLYQLVPREAAGLFMVAITASAVVLSARLDTRLLAALAWFGGYLTPVLLSSGQDRALALFVYLALLGAGALVLDHRRPWPETLPIALTGTVFLYGGWFERYFTPERFEVAAFGMVLFTAMFVLGAASKERRLLPSLLVPLVTIGLTALTGADRPVALLVLSLGAAGLAVAAARTRGMHLAALALLPALVPLAAWSSSFYDAEDVAWAALWLLGAALLVSVPALFWRDAADAPPRGAIASSGVALALAGLGGMVMAISTDRPVALLLFLLAYAAVAIAGDVRRRGLELVGALGAAMTVFGWAVEFHDDGRGGDLLLLALPVWAVFLVQRVVRGTFGATPGASALFTQIVAATLAWSALYNALYPERASLLGVASVALAACYLALALAARKRLDAEGGAGDTGYLRVMLGLAATFVTIAIPVQLGLHGITLAWAFEGALLVVLGLRFGSALARLFGYGVLGLAVLRLFARHLPLHVDTFTPVFNPVFGTWLLVVLAIGFAARALRASPDRLVPGEQVFRYGFATLSMVLLFSLLTGETKSVFEHREQAAWLAQDADAATMARFAGRLAVSVLWTVFATGLLASGLALRSRPLFYSAYALFAVTGLKVLAVDLAGQHPLFRMLSFLALGLLLLVGAWLNIRFRERLSAPDETRAA